jgi:hypothetical protein
MVALHGVKLRPDGKSLRCTCHRGKFPEFLPDGSKNPAYCRAPGKHYMDYEPNRPYRSRR